MTNKIYRLRPHHLNLLCCLISARRSDRKSIESYVRGSIDDVEQYEIDLHNNEGVPKEYSKEFVSSLIEYYNELLGNREAHLEVVASIDDICELGPTGCNRRRAYCERKDSEEILKELHKKLGLKVGDNRRVSWIINKVEGVASPS